MPGKSPKENTEQPIFQNIINVNAPAKKSRAKSTKSQTAKSGKPASKKQEQNRYMLIAVIIIAVIIIYFLLNPNMLPGVHEGQDIRAMPR